MRKSERIISAILTMVIGVLLMVLKDEFVSILMSIAGGCLLVMGIFDIFANMIPSAVVKIVVGLLIILCGWILVEAVLYIVAALLLIAGVLMIYEKIKVRFCSDTLLRTIVAYAIPALFVLIGIFLLFHQAATVDVIFVIAGILTLLEGVVLFADAFNND